MSPPMVRVCPLILGSPGMSPPMVRVCPLILGSPGVLWTTFEYNYLYETKEM